MDWKDGGGGVGRDAEGGWIGGRVFGMEEEELNNREIRRKGRRGERVILWATALF